MRSSPWIVGEPRMSDSAVALRRSVLRPIARRCEVDASQQAGLERRSTHPLAGGIAMSVHPSTSFVVLVASLGRLRQGQGELDDDVRVSPTSVTATRCRRPRATHPRPRRRAPRMPGRASASRRRPWSRTRTSGSRRRESVVFDDTNDLYLVSNINGKPLDVDGNASSEALTRRQGRDAQVDRRRQETRSR